VPADSNSLQQQSLWTLEDDFEGRSTDTQQQEQAPAEEPPLVGRPPSGDERNGQPEGDLAFDGQGTYTYTGYVLDGGRFVRKTCTLSCDELGVYPTESRERVCAMVDRVGRDPVRQEEVRRFGKRAWHCPYRPEDAAVQGLDYIFGHDAGRVAACYPYVAGFYASDAAAADRWTLACYDAYRAFVLQHERAALLRLLAEAEVPLALFGLDPDEQV
jgi:hypothetical protein